MDSLTVFPSSVRHFVTSPSSRRHSSHISSYSGSHNTSKDHNKKYLNTSIKDSFEHVNLRTARSDVAEELNTLDNIAALGLSLQADEDTNTPRKIERFSIEDVDDPRDLSYERLEDRPFNKWVRTLQKRGTGRRSTINGAVEADAIQKEFFQSPGTRRASHKKSSSQSSSGFVTAVRSASISLASFSITTRSRRTDASSRHQRTDKGSRTSHMGRLSEDTTYNTRHTALDQGVTNRSMKRRQVLEEIIRSEESYLGDVKFLTHVYVTLLASVPSLSASLRASINSNLNDIIALHEDLLGDLHRLVPHSEYTQLSLSSIPNDRSSRRAAHSRWKSLDAGAETSTHTNWLKGIPGMTAEPSIAAEVAKAFVRRLHRFFLYEEYGAKYELMIRDVSSAYRTMPQWEVYQKGLEALASSLNAVNRQDDVSISRKALTVGDLLVKPIQRVCRYPLLFAELLKQTPVYDCPDSHLELESALLRLREAVNEINKATDDPRMGQTMERSWLLQDRLVFEDNPGTKSINLTRTLGQNQLCGVLHTAWQTKHGVDGQYMISLLYRSFLLLASASRSDNNELAYHVQACIALNSLKVEDVDNGRGLQCHTAPFSWKIVFENDHQLHEITMTACSPKEELEWKSRLVEQSDQIESGAVEQYLLPSLCLKTKPLGTVFGKPGTVARRLSIQRATTVGPTSLCQVIIKNTNAGKEPSTYSAINRSQSLLTTNRIPVLAPARAERMRLEALLNDVWTRDTLPFPGMTSRIRTEHIVRNSAHSMMRKLSVASITSNFSKRSASSASMRGTMAGEEGSKESTESKTRLHNYKIRDDSQRAQTPAKSKVTIFQFEKENNFRAGSTESLFAIGSVSASPNSPLRKTSPYQVRKGWIRDGERLITPPLRTSSANSTKPVRISSLSTVADSQCAEQSSLSPLIPVPSATASVNSASAKRSKGRALALKKGAVAEGFRSFFR